MSASELALFVILCAGAAYLAAQFAWSRANARNKWVPPRQGLRCLPVPCTQIRVRPLSHRCAHDLLPPLLSPGVPCRACRRDGSGRRPSSGWAERPHTGKGRGLSKDGQSAPAQARRRVYHLEHARGGICQRLKRGSASGTSICGLGSLMQTASPYHIEAITCSLARAIL